MSKALFLGRILTLAVIVAAIVSKAAQAAPYTPPSPTVYSVPAASHSFGPTAEFRLNNFGVELRMK